MQVHHARQQVLAFWQALQRARGRMRSLQHGAAGMVPLQHGIDHAVAVHHDQHVLLDAQCVRSGCIEGGAQQGPSHRGLGGIHHEKRRPRFTWP
jgi:hypothetical protein